MNKIPPFESFKETNRVDNINESNNYMFFSNLEQMKRQIELLLTTDPNRIEHILNDGHNWASDHIAVAKENMDQVFDFMMGELNKNTL